MSLIDTLYAKSGKRPKSFQSIHGQMINFHTDPELYQIVTTSATIGVHDDLFLMWNRIYASTLVGSQHRNSSFIKIEGFVLGASFTEIHQVWYSSASPYGDQDKDAKLMYSRHDFLKIFDCPVTPGYERAILTVYGAGIEAATLRMRGGEYVVTDEFFLEAAPRTAMPRHDYVFRFRVDVRCTIEGEFVTHIDSMICKFMKESRKDYYYPDGIASGGEP